MWTVYFSALGAILSLCCALAAFYVASNAARERESLARNTRLLASRVDSLASSMSEWSVELEGLANRVKMQRVRTAVTHLDPKSSPEKMPDPYKDPDGWRLAMNRKLAQAKVPT